MTVALQTECIIDRMYWQPYDYDDTAWRAVPAPDYLHCSRHIVTSPGGWMVENPHGVWEAVGRENVAITQMLQYWPTFRSGDTTIPITKQRIRQYLDEAAVQFTGKVYLPGAPRFVLSEGVKCVNIWRDGRLTGHAADLEACYPLMRLIRGSLTNVDDENVSFKALIDEIDAPKTPFAWIIHWLAAIYQRPGIRLQSNLWLCGPRQGIGKTALIRVLKQVFGKANIGKASEAELAAGWTDHLGNHLVIEADEFRDSSTKSFLRFLKEFTTNEEVNYRKRHQGVSLGFNCSHWIFSTNDRVPIWVELDNRRDCFIQTVGANHEIGETDWEPHVEERVRRWKRHAFDLRQSLGQPEGDKIVSGFAALLGSVNVNHQFATIPLVTHYKGVLQEATREPIADLICDIRDSEGITLPAKLVNWALNRSVETRHDGYILRSEWLDLAAREYGLRGRTIAKRLATEGLDLKNFFSPQYDKATKSSLGWAIDVNQPKYNTKSGNVTSFPVKTA